MAQFRAATTSGGLRTFEAANQADALKQLSSFGDIAPTSGVQEIKPQQTQVSPTIDMADIGVPTSRRPQAPDTSDLGGSQAMIASIAQRPTGVDVETRFQDRDSVDALAREEMDLQRQLIGMSEFRTGQEEEAGIADLNQQMRDINLAIKQQQAALTQGLVDESGRIIPRQVITGRQAFMERQAAASIAGLEAAQFAIEGQITAANESIDRAIRAKYGPIEERIEIQKRLIATQKERAEGRELLLLEQRGDAIAQEEAALAQQQTLEAEQMSQVTEAMNDGRIDARTGAEIMRSIVRGDTSGLSRIPKVVQKIGTGFAGGSASNLTQAIIENPSLFDDLTATEKGKVLAELQALGYSTTNLGVKGLSDTAIDNISQTEKALEDLAELRSIIEGNQDKLGPITGLAALNPFSEARKIQADVDRVRQTVGKALEGGVLRKEDEEKYKKILATLTDTPSTALYKIEALQSSIQRDIERYKDLQLASGKSLDVRAELTKDDGEEINADELRNKYDY